MQRYGMVSDAKTDIDRENRVDQCVGDGVELIAKESPDAEVGSFYWFSF